MKTSWLLPDSKRNHFIHFHAIQVEFIFVNEFITVIFRRFSSWNHVVFYPTQQETLYSSCEFDQKIVYCYVSTFFRQKTMCPSYAIQAEFILLNKLFNVIFRVFRLIPSCFFQQEPCFSLFDSDWIHFGQFMVNVIFVAFQAENNVFILCESFILLNSFWSINCLLLRFSGRNQAAHAFARRPLHAELSHSRIIRLHRRTSAVRNPLLCDRHRQPMYVCPHVHHTYRERHKRLRRRFHQRQRRVLLRRVRVGDGDQSQVSSGFDWCTCGRVCSTSLSPLFGPSLFHYDIYRHDQEVLVLFASHMMTSTPPPPPKNTLSSDEYHCDEHWLYVNKINKIRFASASSTPRINRSTRSKFSHLLFNVWDKIKCIFQTFKV